MRFNSIFTALILSAFVTGCAEQPSPPHKHAVTGTVHVREVRNTSDDSILWWYIIYSNSIQNSCPCYVASSSTRSSDMSSLSFSRAASVPTAAETSSDTKVVEEETEQEQVEVEAEATEAAPGEATEAAPATETEAAAPAAEAAPAAGGDSAPAGDAGGGGDSGGGGSD